MKNIIILFIIYLFYPIDCQELELPIVFPSSPDVSSLLRFDEIPVSLSTGIPNISNNIINKRINNDFIYSLDLVYHPSNTKYYTLSGDVGLGWSLERGGFITRQINDLPDDRKTFGFIDTSLFNEGFTGNMEDDVINLTYNEKEILFDSKVKNLYDLKSDIYSFSFLGNSGKFIFKNSSNVDSEIVFINSNFKYSIEYIRDETTGAITEFIFRDDLGYTYFFNESFNDSPQLSAQTAKTFNNETVTVNLSGGGNFGTRTWGISKIEDPYGNTLIDFQYEIYQREINVTSSNTMYAEFKNNESRELYQYLETKEEIPSNNGNNDFTYKKVVTNFVNSPYTRKIKRINFIDGSCIKFIKDTYNLENDILSQIDYYDDNNVLIKRINFNYNNFSYNSSKYYLDNFNLESVLNEIDTEQYYFQYNDDAILSNLNPDLWGYNFSSTSNQNLLAYFNNILNYSSSFDKKNFGINLSTIRLGLLNKEILPTGGVREFIWEPNTFSSITGSNEINYYDIPENRNLLSFNENFSSLSPDYERIVNIPFLQNVMINLTATYYSSNSLALNDKCNYHFNFTPIIPENEFDPITDYEIDSSRPSFMIELCESNNSDVFSINKSMKGYYKISISESSEGEITYFHPNEFNISFHYNELTNQYKYLYGGGHRIKEINFWNSIPINFYSTPSKTFSYDYSDLDDNNKSSGVIHRLPTFFYEELVNEPEIIYGSADRSYISRINKHPITYIKSSKTFNTPITKSGDIVLYKNVKVKSSEGYELSFFTTYEDAPEQDVDVLNYPFLPYRDYSSKYGLMLKKEMYNEYDNKILEISNIYDYVEHDVFSGVNLHYFSGGCHILNSFYGSNINNYYSYYSYIQNPIIGSCSDILGILAWKPIKYKNIWTKLSESRKMEYLNTGNIEAITVNNFNNYNKKLSSQTTTSSTGEILEQKFYYPQDLLSEPFMLDLIGENRIATPIKTETYRGTEGNMEKLSETHTFYEDFDLTSEKQILPSSVSTSKFSDDPNDDNDIDQKITYDRYGDKGNILQYILENGIPVSIIWGYGGQYPIAKVEGATYAQIESAVSNLQTLSDNDDDTCTGLSGCDEANLRNALNQLRINHPSFLITYYTYNPLIGVTSITAPDCTVEYYEYDGFGRLETVKDQDGNILKEMEYHYKDNNE